MMPALSAIMATVPKVPAPTGPTLRGVTSRDGAGTLSVPAGTVSGDTLVYVSYALGAGATAPSGFTQVFATPSNGFGYNRQLFVKTSTGESSINATGGTGFDCYLFAFAGSVTVSATYQWTDASSGGTGTYTVATTAKNVVQIASDRGAVNFPTISATGRTYTTNCTATYFRGVVGYYPAMSVGSTVTFTDYTGGGDAYGTSSLFFTVS